MPRKAKPIAIRDGCGFEDLLCERVLADLEELNAPRKWREPLSVYALTIALFWGLTSMPHPNESENPVRNLPFSWGEWVHAQRLLVNAVSILSAEDPGRFFELMAKLSSRMEKRKRSPEFSVILQVAAHPNLANLSRREIVEALKAEPGSTVTLKVVEHALQELKECAIVDPSKPLPAGWVEYPIRDSDSP